MGKHYSFRISDPVLVEKVERFKRTGNLSKLINHLLSCYFDGNDCKELHARIFVCAERGCKAICDAEKSLSEIIRTSNIAKLGASYINSLLYTYTYFAKQGLTSYHNGVYPSSAEILCRLGSKQHFPSFLAVTKRGI